MKKALLIAVVAIPISAIAILLFLNGTLIWDGAASVPIKVSVFDDDRRPVAGAVVSLILPKDMDYLGKITDDEFHELLLSFRRIVKTDELGTGTIRGQFPAGGTAGIFKRRGLFTVVGDIVISHPEFQDFRVSLRNLVQAYEFSIDQKELDVVAFLDTRKAEQDAAGKPATRPESK